MHLLGKAVVATALAFFISQMSGCASSSLVDKWHDPSFKASALSKMLVIAISKDATKRRIWEDAFSGELFKHGVTATSSYGLFPDSTPDTNQVMAAVQTSGFDGILVIMRRPTETTTQYIYGYTTTEQDMRYNSYWQRYWTYYREVDHPGYTDSQKVSIRTIDVTTTGSKGRLIWSATSRTPDPASVTDVQQGIVGLVTSELTQRNIIGSKK